MSSKLLNTKVKPVVKAFIDCVPVYPTFSAEWSELEEAGNSEVLSQAYLVTLASYFINPLLTCVFFNLNQADGKAAYPTICWVKFHVAEVGWIYAPSEKAITGK